VTPQEDRNNGSYDQQKAGIVALVKEGKLDFKQIAKQIGVSPGTVASVKAHMTMGTYGEGPEIEQIAEAIDATFGLERDLQLALRKHIDQLEPDLKIVDDGKEQTVESGRIDITAEDSKGTTVVIELKTGQADRETIGQILGYMGDVMTTKKSVRGILVAGDFPTGTIAAARAVPNLRLKKYSFKFSFESVGDQ
jgi:transposase-like protein